jgi:hypothetical protein
MRPGRGADHPPLLVPRSTECRAIHLPTSGLSSLLGVPLPLPKRKPFMVENIKIHFLTADWIKIGGFSITPHLILVAMMTRLLHQYRRMRNFENPMTRGARWCSWLGTALQTGRSIEFFIYITLAALRPAVDSYS